MLDVGVRRVVLGERHRAGVEPHVDHVGYPAHRFTAHLAGEHDLVDERSVRVLESNPRKLGQLTE